MSIEARDRPGCHAAFAATFAALALVQATITAALFLGGWPGHAAVGIPFTALPGVFSVVAARKAIRLRRHTR